MPVSVRHVVHDELAWLAWSACNAASPESPIWQGCGTRGGHVYWAGNSMFHDIMMVEMPILVMLVPH